jgi:hypothetical protein
MSKERMSEQAHTGMGKEGWRVDGGRRKGDEKPQGQQIDNLYH